MCNDVGRSVAADDDAKAKQQLKVAVASLEKCVPNVKRGELEKFARDVVRDFITLCYAAVDEPLTSKEVRAYVDFCEKMFGREREETIVSLRQAQED